MYNVNSVNTIMIELAKSLVEEKEESIHTNISKIKEYLQKDVNSNIVHTVMELIVIIANDAEFVGGMEKLLHLKDETVYRKYGETYGFTPDDL